MKLLDYVKAFLDTLLHDYQNRKVCQSCETLKSQLEAVNYEKGKLIEQLIEITSPNHHEPEHEIKIELPKPRTLPWKLKQQMLEAEDRERAKLLREHAQAVAGSDKSDEEIRQANDELEAEVLDLARTKDLELENAG